MKTDQLRQAFLDYFKKNQHEIVSSSSLVPIDDPTLLFTNAGMVQFKDVFLGKEQRAYKRASSVQRCVRAGGKHNDLENVGYTARHHTFFEMLGNFSFGDYFKREAIHYAWDFLTKKLNIQPEKLWVTVFRDDDEAAAIWLNEIKVDPARFTRCDEKDNFWAMGDTGPCGPCTEVFYDHGPDVAGGPPGSVDADGDRYIEIWNLVFMQYNRDTTGKLTPLPKPSVDTGMGLERIAAVLQGVHSNYEIDIFQNLINAIAEIIQVTDKNAASLRVLADHIRSSSFLIVDGVVPSNEGRGYVLRRIIRRALRHGNKLGMTEPFFYKIVAPLVNIMGNAYPELKRAQAQVKKVLQTEESQFARTLEQGLKIFTEETLALHGKIIPGEIVFKLYDTYGFPVDLTADIAREKNLTLDIAGFEQAMQKQRQHSKEASQFAAETQFALNEGICSDFSGYEKIHDTATVVAILQDGKNVNAIEQGATASIVLDKTPFYAESGGQVGDRGTLSSAQQLFAVDDTTKYADAILHHGKIHKGKIKVGDQLTAEVDLTQRIPTMLNHSATHLLHAALRKILGEHVTQKGSLVDADRLRFDFAHSAPVNAEQLQQIEDLVNQKIRDSLNVVTEIMTPQAAQQSGAMALFGEKYGDKVRVLSMGDFSKELCGGTHVKNTGQIGLFKITAESGIAAGVRRIEAVTGAAALKLVADNEKILSDIEKMLKANRRDLLKKLEQTLQAQRQLEKQLEQHQSRLASQQGGELTEQAVKIKGINVLAARLDQADVKTLRETLDQLKNKLGTAVIVLANVADNKVNLVAGVTKDCTAKIQAGVLINKIAEQVGGRGGGRADLAQAGGTDPAALDSALQSVVPLVEKLLGG